MHEFHDVFHVKGDGLTFGRDGDHKIFTKPDSAPVNTKQYKIPHAQWETVNTKIDEMLVDGIIEKSTSMWNSPLLFQKYYELRMYNVGIGWSSNVY